MPSLPQVLHEASSRGAQEVVLESGQAPMVRTDAGSVTVGDPLTEMELFDALAQVLGPDQQAELAVGNPVEFVLTVDAGQWRMVSEPRAEGILVRGRGPQPDGGEAAGAGIDLPKLDAGEPTAGGSVPRPNAPILQHGKRTTQWDIGVPSAPEAPRASAPPSTPSWSKRLSDAQGDDSEFEIRTPTGEQPANLVDAHDALAPDADDGDELPELLAPPPVEPTWSGSESAVPSVPRQGLTPPAPTPHPTAAETASTTTSEPVSRRPTPAPESSSRTPSGGTSSGRISETVDDARAQGGAEAKQASPGSALGEIGASMGPGTLCLLQGVGAGDDLGAALADGFVLVDDPRALIDLPLDPGPATNAVVRLEDPSVVLGWCLRQLEAGGRVVVETRARTAGGARRILLGTDGSARAEAWLGAHALIWVTQADGDWSAAELTS